MNGNMSGKVAVVTGASSGIGLETARGLARLGAHVVMVGRNPERSHAALEAVQAAAAHRDLVELVPADFARLDSVRALGAAISGRHRAIDVLVNNAGTINVQREVTVDGHEATFQVNHLAPFLLTGLLLPSLKAAPAARIVNVSSNAHIGARLDFDNLQLERGYRAFKAYGRSKLSNLYFTFALARRLAGSTITVNALHPGFVASGFARNNGAVANIATNLSRLVALSPEQGADTPIYLASADEVAGVTAGYFYKRRQIRPTATARDAASAERLWTVSEELTGYPYRGALPGR